MSRMTQQIILQWHFNKTKKQMHFAKFIFRKKTSIPDRCYWDLSKTRRVKWSRTKFLLTTVRSPMLSRLTSNQIGPIYSVLLSSVLKVNLNGKVRKIQVGLCISTTMTYNNNSSPRYQSVILNPFSAVTDFRRQNQTSIDVGFWRPKSIPSLKKIKNYNDRRPTI